MTLLFVTSNPSKVSEVTAILETDIKQVELDIPEIQSLDIREITKYKLDFAKQHTSGPLLVEDQGLYLDALKGFPGPFIKWFLKAFTLQEINTLAETHNSFSAKAISLFGYLDENNNEHFFEGVTKGIIVSPQGEHGFGWDPIFKPDGYEKTFAQMTAEEKNAMSLRREALEKLKKHLKNQ